MGEIGKPLDRVDGRLKVTGAAVYAAENPVGQPVHAVIVSSAVSSGTVKDIDVRAAKAAPGVLAVLAYGTAPKLPDANKQNTPQDKILQLLQDDAVHYPDQPVAVVVAETLERAQHAADLVKVTYETRPGAYDLAAASDSYKPDHAGPRGETDTTRGDVAAGLAAAKFKVSATYTTPVHTHHPMEMHATIAEWQMGDRLTVYDSTQGIFNVRERLATIFGIDKQNVRVIDKFVGGGFGSKGSPWSHVALAAMAARVVKRPVKLVVTRAQMSSLVGHRPVTIQDIQLGCDSAGKLTAIEHRVRSETSRFDEFVEPSALQTRHIYACPNVVTQHRVTKLDISTPTFTRAPGEATGTYALEAAMDELAYAANIDPLELRIRNYSTMDEQEKKPFSSKELMACYKSASAKFGWSKRTMAPRSMHDGSWLVGWGMATATYPARQMPASARATRRTDGTFLVQAGTQDIGTGTYTIMTQIAADALGVPVDKVTFELGDTNLPEAPLSAGSMTAATVGPAVKLACGKLREAMKAQPTGELTAEHRTEVSKDHEKWSMHSHGAVFADVRVDEELGIIRVARVVAAYAGGTILNAKTARSQLIGGVVWSLGMALEEEAVRDRKTGRVITRDLADYHVPVHADVPDIDITFVAETDPHVNEVGAKGLGEIGNTGASAAIANAVFHATGKRVRELPIRLDKLLPGGGRA
jgi:xanthine dehydrogenase YagR molybdenum-binding subunit